MFSSHSSDPLCLPVPSFLRKTLKKKKERICTHIVFVRSVFSSHRLADSASHLDVGSFPHTGEAKCLWDTTAPPRIGVSEPPALIDHRREGG